MFKWLKVKLCDNGNLIKKLEKELEVNLNKVKKLEDSIASYNLRNVFLEDENIDLVTKNKILNKKLNSKKDSVETITPSMKKHFINYLDKRVGGDTVAKTGLGIVAKDLGITPAEVLELLKK